MMNNTLKVLFAAIILLLLGLGWFAWNRSTPSADRQSDGEQAQQPGAQEQRRFVGFGKTIAGSGGKRLSVTGGYAKAGQWNAELGTTVSAEVALDSSTKYLRTLNTQEGEPFVGKFTTQTSEVSAAEFLADLGEGTMQLAIESMSDMAGQSSFRASKVEYSKLVEIK